MINIRAQAGAQAGWHPGPTEAGPYGYLMAFPDSGSLQPEVSKEEREARPVTMVAVQAVGCVPG